MKDLETCAFNSSLGDLPASDTEVIFVKAFRIRIRRRLIEDKAQLFFYPGIILAVVINVVTVILFRLFHDHQSPFLLFSRSALGDPQTSNAEAAFIEAAVAAVAILVDPIAVARTDVVVIVSVVGFSRTDKSGPFRSSGSGFHYLQILSFSSLGGFLFPPSFCLHNTKRDLGTYTFSGTVKIKKSGFYPSKMSGIRAKPALFRTRN